MEMLLKQPPGVCPILTLECALNEDLFEHVVEGDDEDIEEVVLPHHLTRQALVAEQLRRGGDIGQNVCTIYTSTKQWIGAYTIPDLLTSRL